MKATACSRTPKLHLFNYVYIVGLRNINDKDKKPTNVVIFCGTITCKGDNQEPIHGALALEVVGLGG